MSATSGLYFCWILYVIIECSRVTLAGAPGLRLERAVIALGNNS